MPHKPPDMHEDWLAVRGFILKRSPSPKLVRRMEAAAKAAGVPPFIVLLVGMRRVAATPPAELLAEWRSWKLSISSPVQPAAVGTARTLFQLVGDRYVPMPLAIRQQPDGVRYFDAQGVADRTGRTIGESEAEWRVYWPHRHEGGRE